MKTIKHLWKQTESKEGFFKVEKPVFELGDYRIYKLWDKNFVYTYKDMAFNQLAGLNKGHLKRVANRDRPQGAYSPKHFLYDRAIQNLNKFKNK